MYRIVMTGAFKIHPGSPAPSYAWGARGNCPLCPSPRYATDLEYSIVHRPFFAMAALCDGGPLPFYHRNKTESLDWS